MVVSLLHWNNVAKFFRHNHDVGIYIVSLVHWDTTTLSLRPRLHISNTLNPCCQCFLVPPQMYSERDSPLEPFVSPAPGQPELAWLICGAHLSPPVLTRKQKRPRVNSLMCDRAAAFCAAGPPEVLSRMSRLVTQATEHERELARACSQQLKQAARSLPGESVSPGFAGRGALEGYPSHYTSLVPPRQCLFTYSHYCMFVNVVLDMCW